MTYWEWLTILVVVGFVHYRVMQNKKSISNLFCILEDHNIKITRVFKPMSFREAWSGDIVDPPRLPPGTDVFEAYRQEEEAKEEVRSKERRKWWRYVFIGVVIAAVLIFVAYQL